MQPVDLAAEEFDTEKKPQTAFFLLISTHKKINAGTEYWKKLTEGTLDTEEFGRWDPERRNGISSFWKR